MPAKSAQPLRFLRPLSVLLFVSGALIGPKPICAQTTLPAAGHETRDLFGIWSESRGKTPPAELKRKCPWVKGTLVQFKWKDLEPEDGEFDWKFFDKSVGKFADADLYVMFQVWAGPASPDWLGKAGVPTVKTSGKGEAGKHDTFPYYLDPTYKALYARMIRSIAQHIDTLPPAVRERIVCVESAEGSTGDVAPYKGAPLDQKYVIEPEAWNQFKRETWLLLDSLYRQKNPPIHLLITVGSREDNEDDSSNSGWLLEHLPSAWRKATGSCQMYQMRGEDARLRVGDPLYFTPDVNGDPRTRSRGELSMSEAGWFQEAPVWNMYWMNLWVLHFGVDMFMLKNPVIEDPGTAEGFHFFAQYAGIKDPALSPGAWCALRDGLDGNDHERFPDSRFGEGFKPKRKNLPAAAERSVKIAQAFADHGALQPDPDGLSAHASPKALNDVGWDIYPGNYGRFLTQYDPAGTSVGYWRVGPKDQPYGRFARGFDTKAGKDTLSFTLADHFFGTRRPNAATPVTIRVIYFDQGAGKWALQYDAMSGTKTALEITKTNTQRWKQADVAVDDGCFEHRCANHTDLLLQNTGNEDTIFHLVELTRGK